MARVPGTRKQGRWLMVNNPALAGLTPRLLVPACHDGTPMIDVTCSYCGATNHVHESQLAGEPGDSELAMRCSECRQQSVTTVHFLREGFADMRAAGWYE